MAARRVRVVGVDDGGDEVADKVGASGDAAERLHAAAADMAAASANLSRAMKAKRARVGWCTVLAFAVVLVGILIFFYILAFVLAIGVKAAINSS